MHICLYPPSAEDFSTNGLGILTPIECTIEEEAAGKYELELVHPIDSTLRWMQINVGCIIKAPSPVRESPMYEYSVDVTEGETVTVTRSIYKANTDRMYLRQSPGSTAKKLCSLPHHTRVVLLEYDGVKWAKVAKVDGGQVGWCPFGGLTLVGAQNEIVSESKVVGQRVVQLAQSRDQLFRIYSVEQDTEAATVTAKAMHIYYDDAGNLMYTEYEPKDAPLAEVMSTFVDKLVYPPVIQYHALNLDDKKLSGTFSYKTPIEAYLDPDEGIVEQTGALLIRDNFDAFLLPDTIRDNGVTIRRGKNLLGVEVTNDISDLVTQIIPVGKNKDGDPIYIVPVVWNSPHIDEYPFRRIKRIEYDVQIGDDFKNTAAVQQELQRLAQEEFDVNGVDLPTYGMEVDFILLQNTQEYANFASLQAVHLYDTVTVIDEMLGLKAKVRVTGYTWDCLALQYEKVKLGELQDVKQTVYSYNLPNKGVSGNKIADNTLPGTAMRNASIEYAKITNAAIERLSAQAITALTARIQEIVAEKLTTDELYAAYAEMIALKVGTITADSIETDDLAAELARITVLMAGTAEFNQATIKHLVAEAMNLEYGVAGQVFIKNLAVEYAQMVGATIGELCIKASDGNYYLLDVAPDGSVSATLTNVSGSEAAAGQTSGGQIILETNITAANLNAGNLLATYALINQIDAARIDVDQLFAREAFVGLLRTTKIVGETSIEMVAKRAANAGKTFRQEDAPTGADGINPGDLWIIPGTEQMYQAEDASDAAVEFYLGSDGALYYTTEADGVEAEMQEYDLYMSGVSLNVSADGEIGAAYRWALVQDKVLADEIAANKEAFDRVVRIDDDGLHVGDNQTANEVLIDSESVNIVIENQRYSKFAAQYVQFGNYKIGIAEDGGLMFKPM